ncbi:hypothetical protein [Sulfurimonas sp.]|uniref:hypothetical protein n=1 Tax=Sulfurimonas sp. TaxID=2022749 RepID=UPI0025EB492F|nr:hypothetical protein [Sulfurimonas sp.]
MKIFISIIFIVTTILAQTNMNDNIKHNEVQTSKQICKENKSLEVKQRGCCSWHGGVSGCSNGRVTCNDGTYSPSCTCVVPQSPLG